jgi:hypothetical protein
VNGYTKGRRADRMRIHDTTALAGYGTGSTRALALCVPFSGCQALGIDDMNVCGRAGTRGGGS